MEPSSGSTRRRCATLRERLRIRLGRNAGPSAAIVDSQSAKTTGVGGERRGYDGGKEGSWKEVSPARGY